MEYYSAIKRNSSESVLVLEPVIQSDVSQKEKRSIMGHPLKFGIGRRQGEIKHSHLPASMVDQDKEEEG